MLAMVGSMAAYSVSDALTKLASKSLPLGEVLAIRGIFTVLLIGALLTVIGQMRYLRLAMTPLILTRSAFDALSSGCYVDRKSTRLNSSHMSESRMPSSA